MHARLDMIRNRSFAPKAVGFIQCIVFGRLDPDFEGHDCPRGRDSHSSPLWISLSSHSGPPGVRFRGIGVRSTIFARALRASLAAVPRFVSVLNIYFRRVLGSRSPQQGRAKLYVYIYIYACTYTCVCTKKSHQQGQRHATPCGAAGHMVEPSSERLHIDESLKFLNDSIDYF